MFHVSQLKKAVVSDQLTASPLSSQDWPLHVPERILQTRMVAKGNKFKCQVRVQWSGMDEALATWEDYEALKQQFPQAPAWRQAGFYGGGM